MLYELFDLWCNNGKTLREKIENVNEGNRNEIQSLRAQDPVYFVPGHGYRLTADGRSVSIWRGGVDEIAYYEGTKKFACNITEERNKAFNIRARIHAQRDGKKSYVGKVKTYDGHQYRWYDCLFETESDRMIELGFCYSMGYKKRKCIYHCVKKYCEPFKDWKDYKENEDKELSLIDARKVVGYGYITLKEFANLYFSAYDSKYYFMKNENNFFKGFCDKLMEDGLCYYEKRSKIIDFDKLDTDKYINCYQKDPFKTARDLINQDK